MNSLFFIIAGLAALTGLIAAILIWRARKPAAAPKPWELLARLRPAGARLHTALGQLGSQFGLFGGGQEWRYRSEWVLLLGERGSGKTSLAKSVSPELRHVPDWQQQSLQAQGTAWNFFPQGVLIDPDGQLPAAPAGGAKQAQWLRVLGELNALRPERPLDGLLLTVSARSLRDKTPTQRLALADQIGAQLRLVQKQVEFVLPIYVVITGADAIDGFGAFWEAQPQALRSEMFGWSLPQMTPAPTMAATPSNWVERAFDHLGARLKALQVQAAADNENLGAVLGRRGDHDGGGDGSGIDDFFLFPRHFEQLRKPLRDWLSVVLRESSWAPGYCCRGLYFTGCVEKGATEEARGDVSFVDDLIVKKVLAEPRLARPTRTGVWSRNALIRKLQYGSAAAFALLLALLGSDALRLNRQAHATEAVLAEVAKAGAAGVQGAGADGECVSRDRVYGVIDRIAGTDTDTSYWTMPVSWGDYLGGRSAQRLAEDGLQKVVYPGIACRLEQIEKDPGQQPDGATGAAGGTEAGVGTSAEASAEASTEAMQVFAYLDAKKALFDYMRKVEAFERNLERLRDVAAASHTWREGDLVDKFRALAAYSYQAELPKAAASDRGALRAVLRKAVYTIPQPLNAPRRADYSNRIESLSQDLAGKMSGEVNAGKTLLATLQIEKTPPLKDSRHFAAWLAWVQSDWSGSSVTSNPCADIDGRIEQQSAVLRGYYYPTDKLREAASAFDASNCYRPAVGTLKAMQMAPYGSLLTAKDSGKDSGKGNGKGSGKGSKLSLNPQLVNELNGLNALNSLPFMQVENPASFSCQSKISGWRPDSIGLANNYVDQYDKFVYSMSSAKAGTAASGTTGKATSGATAGATTGATTATTTTTGATTAGTTQRPLYQQVALRQLELALNDSMVQAQQPGQPNTVQVDPASNADQQLSRESGNFNGLVTPLLKLLRSYQTMGFASEASLGQCIRDYASVSLQQVQNLSKISRIYEVTPTSGAPANGTKQLFDLGSTPVIQDYLSRQLARSQVLAGYATPFLTYLKNSDGLDDSQRTNTESAAYWTNTITELNKYVQFKDPSSQVAQLENLFLKQLPNLTVENCTKTIADAQPAAKGNDLFSKQREKLDGQAEASCSGGRAAAASSAFNTLTHSFNDELAGKYPFGPLSAPDADLATVKTFFANYETQKANLKQSLKDLPGPYWDQARDFLSQLNAVDKFFYGTLVTASSTPSQGASSGASGATASSTASASSSADDNDSSGGDSQPVSLTVQFQAQAGSSPGSDQIVAWLLTSRLNTAAFPNGGASLAWSYGQAIALDMTWANRSLLMPAADPQQKDLQVEGGTASYAASGNWALLRMIMQHRPAGSDPGASRLLLAFQVPTVANPDAPGASAAGGVGTTGTAVPYIALTLNAKDPKTQAPIMLKLPATFPQSAP